MWPRYAVTGSDLSHNITQNVRPFMYLIYEMGKAVLA